MEPQLLVTQPCPWFTRVPRSRPSHVSREGWRGGGAFFSADLERISQLRFLCRGVRGAARCRAFGFLCQITPAGSPSTPATWNARYLLYSDATSPFFSPWLSYRLGFSFAISQPVSHLIAGGPNPKSRAAKRRGAAFPVMAVVLFPSGNEHRGRKRERVQSSNFGSGFFLQTSRCSREFLDSVH